MSEDNSAVDEVLALKHEVPSSMPPRSYRKRKRQVWQDMLGW